MEQSLRVRAIHALSWSFVQEVAARTLQLGLGILLARILAPREFGLIAMLTVFIATAQALADGGFAAALIQGRQPTEAHKSSIFYFNIFISLLLAGSLWLAAPWVGKFYHQPLIASMMRVLAFLPAIDGFGVVQNALLMRDLDFKKQTTILVASLGLSGAVGVILAWHGFGVWSLVTQQVMQSVIRAGLLWALNSWRPKLLFSLKALLELFSFGWGMLCSVLVNTVNDNLYPLIIGRFFSAADLGFYNRAQTLQINAAQGLGGIANRVTFPMFAGLQNDLVRFRSGLRKAMITIAFLQFPIMVGVAVIARPLILFLLTEKWSPSIPYLQLLAFVGLLYPIHLLNLNVLLSLGRSDLFFRLEVIKVMLFLFNAFATFRWGMMAMIWGQVIFSILAYFLNSYYTKTLIAYSVWEQLRDLCPYLTASLIMGLLVIAVSSFLPVGNFGQLVFRVLFGALVYFLICQSLRLWALGELVSIIFRRGAAVSLAQ